MMDWLHRNREDPAITLGGQSIPIAIRRHPTAQRMIMRLAPDCAEIRITMPRWGRTAEALAFAHSRRQWLETQMERIGRAGTAPPLKHGSCLLYRGAHIQIDWNTQWPRQSSLQGSEIRVGGPEETLVARIARWMEGEARTLMAGDLAEYCAAAGQDIPALRLSRAQRRWGSCSGDRTIRINWRLVMAPDAIRRSVVAHEVAHLVHFDHGPAFHALLGEIYEGNIKTANLWLKEHGRSLYAHFG